MRNQSAHPHADAQPPPDVTAEWLESLGIPVIQVFHELFPKFDSVCVNDERGPYLAVRYLLMAGHRRILCIGVKTRHWRGYVKAHDEMGLPVDEERALLTGVLRDQVNMMEAKVLRSGATAVFSHTEYAALETIQACKHIIDWQDETDAWQRLCDVKNNRKPLCMHDLSQTALAVRLIPMETFGAETSHVFAFEVI